MKLWKGITGWLAVFLCLSAGALAVSLYWQRPTQDVCNTIQNIDGPLGVTDPSCAPINWAPVYVLAGLALVFVILAVALPSRRTP